MSNKSPLNHRVGVGEKPSSNHRLVTWSAWSFWPVAKCPSGRNPRFFAPLGHLVTALSKKRDQAPEKNQCFQRLVTWSAWSPTTWAALGVTKRRLRPRSGALCLGQGEIDEPHL
jgi:hypothetical protein